MYFFLFIFILEKLGLYHSFFKNDVPITDFDLARVVEG